MSTVTSLRDKIFDTDDIQSEVVEVPQWNVKIEVRGLDGRTRARMMQKMAANEGQVDFESFYPEIIVATAFDPKTNEPVFEQGDADALNSKSGAALELLAQTALRLSGMNAEAVDDAGKGSS